MANSVLDAAAARGFAQSHTVLGSDRVSACLAASLPAMSKKKDKEEMKAVAAAK